MTQMPRFDIFGSALADPRRSRMLCELMDGRAYTNKELAAAGIAPQTASAHLGQLRDAGLIASEKSGRCVYHRIAGADIAEMLERLAGLAPSDVAHRAHQPRGASARLRHARSCYDHLAGRLGVAIADALRAPGALRAEKGGYVATPSPVWPRFGVTLPARRGPRPFARPCLDWTERRPHVAGPLGRQIMAHAFGAGWLRRDGPGRGLIVTAGGFAALEAALGLDRAAIGAGED